VKGVKNLESNNGKSFTAPPNPNAEAFEAPSICAEKISSSESPKYNSHRTTLFGRRKVPFSDTEKL
jgi:hypothetical protein